MNHREGVERSIEALASAQYGVVGRAQMIECGATRRMIERRLGTGEWLPSLPGVYRFAAVPCSRRQRFMATVLWSAPDGMVSHLSAGEASGLDVVAVPEVHLTTPSARRLRHNGVVVHRTTDLIAADVATLGPIRLTSPLRTVIDLAAVLDEDALELAIESGLRRRLFSIGQLRWRAEALLGTGRPGSRRLRRLLARRDLGSADSGWEVRTAHALERAGLPRPVRQHEVRAGGRLVARVDLAYPRVKVAFEYDSDRWHHGVARRHTDAERRNHLRALGWTVIEVTPATLRHPDDLVALASTLLAA